MMKKKNLIGKIFTSNKINLFVNTLRSMMAILFAQIEPYTLKTSDQNAANNEVLA